MERLAMLLVAKAKRIREARGCGTHDQTVINNVSVRRNKYDTGFVFFSSFRATSIYIDDDPKGIDNDEDLKIIARSMLTTGEVMDEVHRLVSDDLDKAISFLS